MTEFTNSRIGYAPSPIDNSVFRVTADIGGEIAEVYAGDCTDTEAKGNARLLTAAWNAFQSAAESLGTDAIEFAEYCRNGRLADLVTELRAIGGFLMELRDDDGSTRRPTAEALTKRWKGVQTVLEAVQPSIKRYTVMLLYPDDLRDAAETYLACVEARTPEQAVTLGRQDACETMFIDPEDRPEVRENFALLAVFAGHVACVLDGQDA